MTRGAYGEAYTGRILNVNDLAPNQSPAGRSINARAARGVQEINR